MFASQLLRAGKYAELKPCISVLVLGEKLLPTGRPVLELPKLGAADLADELPSRGYPRAL